MSRQEDFIEAGIKYRFEHGKPMAIGGDAFGDMTREEQDKLRRTLYNAKFTTDAEDENPFVGIYFQDLLGIIHNYGQQHPNWISVEKELPKEEGNYLCCDDDDYVGQLIWINNSWKGSVDDTYIIHGITHWMPLPQPPRKEE